MGHSLASPDRSLKTPWQFGKFKRWWTSPTRRMLRKPEACHTRELLVRLSILAQATVSPPLSICLPTQPCSKADTRACVVLIVSTNSQKWHGEMMSPSPPIYHPPYLSAAVFCLSTASSPGRCCPGQAWIWSVITILLHFQSQHLHVSSCAAFYSSRSHLITLFESCLVMVAEMEAGTGTQGFEAVPSWG